MLILPACYALSDIEARRIAEFCRRGGTVIADFACGLFDQHGKGRSAGSTGRAVRRAATTAAKPAATSSASGCGSKPTRTAASSYRKYRELFATLDCKLEDGYAVAEKRLRDAGRPQGRQGHGGLCESLSAAIPAVPRGRRGRRCVEAAFMQHLVAAGVKPWVR